MKNLKMNWMGRFKMTQRQMVQIPAEQVKKLLDIDKIRSDLADYPISKKVHILLQEKLADVFQSKSFFPHGDSYLKGKWFEYIREILALHVIAPLAIGIPRYSKEMLGCEFTMILCANEGDKSWWGNLKQDIYNVGKFLLINLRDKKFSETHYHKHQLYYKELRNLCEQLKNTDLSKLSKAQLLKEYSAVYLKLMRYYALSWDIDAMDIYLEAKMKKKFEELFGDKLTSKELTDKYNIVTSPSNLSYVNKEQIEIYYITREISLNNDLSNILKFDTNEIVNALQEFPEITKKINALVQEYWWTSLGWSVRTERTMVSFVDDIKKILRENPNVEKEIARLKKFVQYTKEEKNRLKKEFDDEMLYYSNIFDHYVIFHDYRKEIQMKGTYMMNQFLAECSRRFGGKFEDLQWCWPDEIKEYILTGKIDYSLCRSRKEAFFMIVTANSIEQYTGEQAIARRKQELAADVEDIHDFKGVTASVGKVQGKAKVCFSAAEAVQKVKQGDILVASMTMPDYLPAMKKASAVVTDEGGVTCHAAIVSRELKIPCVVGTRVATRVIRDGNLIEVNANHGVVKILEKN